MISSNKKRHMDVHQFTSDARKLIDDQLAHLLALTDKQLPYSSLFSSARYSALSPGKRLRPMVVLAVCKSYGVDLNLGLIPACALEMVHTYSLIHDDLPCMDDDEVRRGQPTLHKVYPEWHALLTGDFLLTYAFEVLSFAPHLNADQKLALVKTLARHAGAHGMIGGQMIDLLSEGKEIGWELLKRMHLGKTAGLITAALEFGGIVSQASDADMEKLRQAGPAIGLAFQLIDDLLDEADEASIPRAGKFCEFGLCEAKQNRSVAFRTSETIAEEQGCGDTRKSSGCEDTRRSGGPSQCKAGERSEPGQCKAGERANWVREGAILQSRSQSKFTEPDGARYKATAVSILGTEKVKIKALELLQIASDHASSLSRPAPLLFALFEQMVDRKN
jgi:geranylgeranyl diphosphate synthase type II